MYLNTRRLEWHDANKLSEEKKIIKRNDFKTLKFICSTALIYKVAL